MLYIFVDYEMNVINKSFSSQRSVCKNEIIEIGAVMLDESYEVIDELSLYVKPRFGEITAYYTNLTGITNEMVEDAPDFTQAMEKFYEWSRMQKEEITIYSWSESDSCQLKHEAILKQMYDERMEKLLFSWKDFQEIFGKMLGVHKKISLKDAVGATGQKFKGRQHSAMCDARNTAYIFQLSKDEKKFQKVMRPIIDLFKPHERMTVSLGDMLGNSLWEFGNSTEENS